MPADSHDDPTTPEPTEVTVTLRPRVARLLLMESLKDEAAHQLDIDTVFGLNMEMENLSEEFEYADEVNRFEVMDAIHRAAGCGESCEHLGAPPSQIPVTEEEWNARMEERRARQRQRMAAEAAGGMVQ